MIMRQVLGVILSGIFGIFFFGEILSIYSSGSCYYYYSYYSSTTAATTSTSGGENT